MVFLPKSLEDQIASGGYEIAGGVPPWADKVPHHLKALAQKVLKPLKTIRGGNGISIKSVDSYSPNELMTRYAGLPKSNGKYIFSKHVYPVTTNHLYCDGFFGAGARTAERLAAEMSVGSAINSSRLDGAVHNGGNNCYVDWKHYILDYDGMIRIPVRARGEVGADEELVYDYAFNAGHNGAFKRDCFDSESDEKVCVAFFLFSILLNFEAPLCLLLMC
jgi:hypothetical protein